MPASDRVTFRRFSRRSRSPGRSRDPHERHRHRYRRAARAGMTMAALSLALAAAAQFPRPSQALAASTGTAKTAVGYATSAHAAYLSARAAAVRTGRELRYQHATRVRGRAATSLLQAAPGKVHGLDVSDHQGNVDWSSVAADGGRFAYIKATEGTYYTNPYFAQQYNGAHDAGLFRGAYHFAIPSDSSGAAQADYFVSHGGAWSADNRTLPGALDIEYNPHGPECYGLSQNAMVSWIRSFIDEYHARTGRWAVIYTTTDWWSKCTGNYGGFAGNDPLWIASYSSSTGSLPADWGFHTFWQYADAGALPGDQDAFNGSASRLLALADNT